MTEEEWLASSKPATMLPFVQVQAGERRLRLFAGACCRRVWHLLTDERSRQAVAFAEQLGDRPNRPVDDEWRAVRYEAERATGDVAGRGRQMGGDEPVTPVAPQNVGHALAWIRAAKAAALAVSEGAGSAANMVPEWTAMAAGFERSGDGKPEHSEPFRHVERQQQAVAFRDIVGNPFRPVALDPSWLASTVLALATGIYEERAFDRMPILADALQDAGCDDDDVLNHCRDPKQVHVSGCWVVDLVLGKE